MPIERDHEEERRARIERLLEQTRSRTDSNVKSTSGAVGQVKQVFRTAKARLKDTLVRKRR